MCILLALATICFYTFWVTLFLWIFLDLTPGIAPTMYIFFGVFAGILKSSSFEEVAPTLNFKEQQKEGGISYDILGYLCLYPLAGARD
jgi:zinc transporter ZupT